MIVAGIDPSLSGTAVVVGDGRSKPVTQVFSSHRVNDTVRGRFMRYENQVASVDKFLAIHKPEVIYIEGYVLGGPGDSSRLVEYGSLLRWHLLEFGDVYEVAPSTLKKFATGNGGRFITKEIVAQHLNDLYELHYPTFDQYDAFAAWRFGLVAEGVVESDRPHQRSCVDDFLNKPATKKRRTKKKQPKVAAKRQPVNPPLFE